MSGTASPRTLTSRTRLTASLARAAAWGARLAGRGGTALPGLIAERLQPGFVGQVTAAFGRGAIMVTGTNGKTTTSSLLAAVLRDAGYHVIHNRTGSNLLRGLAATLAEAAPALDDAETRRRTIGVLEVDEAVLALAAPIVRPRLIVFTNLFRDQLDRYAELDVIADRWRQTLGMLDGTSIVINGDDPRLAALHTPAGGRRLTFGLGDPKAADNRGGQTSDSRWCPVCGKRLVFDLVWFAHIGVYHCDACGFRRPEPDVEATSVTERGFEGTDVNVRAFGADLRCTMALPGVFNIYNGLAALTTALAIGVPAEVAGPAVGRFQSAFGRAERFQIGGTAVTMMLVKNPTGFDQVIRTVLSESRRPDLLLALNDRIADGRDVSWIWDVDFERLAESDGHFTVTGDRAAELALRLKYAGADTTRVTIVPETEAALDAAMKRSAGDLYVLPTYTAMLELHAIVSRRAGGRRFWENAHG